MATRGRKPKPTAMKELEGNPGKHPLNTSEPKPTKKAPACPKWLEPEAKKEWRRLAKQSIINAYAAKSGLTHARIANLMSNETWMNAKKAVELGFADEILFSKKEDEPDSDPADPDKPEKTPNEEPGEGEEKKPFQQDAAGHLFSSRQMDLIVLNRLGVKPDTPAAQTEPPSDLPAEAGPVLDMDGKTEEGDYSYNVLMKQLECMK